MSWENEVISGGTLARRVDPGEVRARLGEPTERTRMKKSDRIDKYVHRFIAHSPFLTMATADAAGNADCTPRGDYPGFAKVLDDRTLAIPDRPGNKLADSFGNLAENDGIGLLFLVPGVVETVRVNGRAYCTDEPDVLIRMRTEASTPEFAIVVEVAEVYFHCGRALLRSRLWDAASQDLAAEIPSMGEMVAEMLGGDSEAIERQLRAGYRELF